MHACMKKTALRKFVISIMQAPTGEKNKPEA